MSTRWSIEASADTCSGAMYVGVPTTPPGEVSPTSVPEPIGFATPKSASRT